MTIQSLAATLSQFLQNNWSLSSPLSKTDILWTDNMPDVLQMPQWTKNVLIAVYNPTNPVSTKVLANALWEVTEMVCVDIYVRATSTIDAAAVVRETIRQECYRIIHVNQLNVSGQKTCDIRAERSKVEGPEFVRLCLIVAAVSWDLRP